MQLANTSTRGLWIIRLMITDIYTDMSVLIATEFSRHRNFDVDRLSAVIVRLINKYTKIL